MILHKTKTDIVNLILSQYKDIQVSPWKDYTTDELIFHWFVTGRSGEGLRLTDSGNQALLSIGIEYYDFAFSLKPPVRWNQFLLILDRKVKTLYYLGAKKIDNSGKNQYIRFYDSKIAMLVTLYGDLESYLSSLK